MFRRRGRQHGQVAVLFAVGSLALVGMVGLVLMAGMLFWNQRQLQVLADGAALTGAVEITQSCGGSTPISAADQFMAQQLGATPNSVPNGWSCGTPVTFSYGSSVTATYTYPWNNHAYEIGVQITRAGIPLQFGAFIGTSQATISGRAVAQHSFASLPKTFALYAQNGATCQGSGVGTSSPKLDVNGSIYAGQSILTGNGSTSPQSIIFNGNCAPWAHDTIAFDGSEDYGDILAYDDNQVWLNGGQCQGGPPGNAACADGFEVAGHDSTNCGIIGVTEYLKDSTSVVPDPCQGVAPPVPLLNEANYAGTEPNADTAIANTIGGPCSPTGNPASTRSIDYFSVKSNKNILWGFGPSPEPTIGSTVTFQPGCYGYLDLGTFLNLNPSVTTVKLAPGFYYFNGYDCGLDNASGCGNNPATGGGLCLNGANVTLHAIDATYEFVNSTSFSTSSCSSGPTSACGNNIACDFGTSTPAPGTSKEKLAISTSAAGTPLPAGTYGLEMTYTNSFGETTGSSSAWLGPQTIAAGSQISLTVTGAPFEATGANLYITSAPAGVTPGRIACASASSCTLKTTDQGSGDALVPPTTNTATDWFAAPPTSPEPSPTCPTPGCPALTDLVGGPGVLSNLPAGTYSIEETYRDPEGETSPNSPAVSLAINAGDQLEITTPSAPQGVTTVAVYLTAAPAGVTTGYLGQLTAPVRAPINFLLTSKTQANASISPPAAGTNTTSSSWCTASKLGTAADAAVCADRLIWAPPAGSPLGEIGGTFYVKGPNENSAIMGNIYWPGPAGSTPSANAAGCNYDANGVGGMIGQVICDSVLVQGGSQAGTATIGYTTGAKYASPPEVSLVE